MGYERFYKTTHYTQIELIQQAKLVKKLFPTATISFKRGKLVLTLELQPTENSIVYSVTYIAFVGSRIVNVFVSNPKIEKNQNGKAVPHMYKDRSLCLYYPSYREWNYTDAWAETLIPWTSLWLYYYEIWTETGEWLGGGIHGKDIS